MQNSPGAFASAYWSILSLQVFQSDGTPAPVAHASPLLAQGKNETLPLLSTPLAAGGVLPPQRKVRRGWDV